MAARTQWSIGMLMILVLMAATDCGLVRLVLTAREADWAVFILLTPMINLLILGLLRMRTKPETRRFWTAFEVMGWFLTSLLAVVCLCSPDIACLPLDLIYTPFELYFQRLAGWSSSASLRVTYILLAIVLFYGLLPALAASIVGWFSDRYRIMIVRRPGTRTTPSLDRALEA